MDMDDYPFPTKKKDAVKKPKPIARQKFLGLENYLKTSVIGQDPAIDAIVSSLKRSQVGLGDEDRPLGVLLFPALLVLEKHILPILFISTYLGTNIQWSELTVENFSTSTRTKS